MTNAKRVGFIGGGQIARALAQGIVRAGLVSAHDIAVSDPALGQLNGFLAQVPGALSSDSNAGVLSGCETVFLAVKPQVAENALVGLRGRFTPEHLLISVVAGITTDQLRDWSGTGRVVRTMPNTPCLIAAGASAYAVGLEVNAADATWVRDLLSSVGYVVELPESLLDAVTGLSGSGTGFVYLMIESLVDAGVAEGLPREVALQLAARTLRGTAEMVLTTGVHPAELRDRVASPGGTTMAGLTALWQYSLPAALMAAVSAATRRSRELSSSHVGPTHAVPTSGPADGRTR